MAKYSTGEEIEVGDRVRVADEHHISGEADGEVVFTSKSRTLVMLPGFGAEFEVHPSRLELVQSQEQSVRDRQIQDILEWLAEETDCYYDHHGLCQAHYLSEKEKCPVLVAKRLLGRTDG